MCSEEVQEQNDLNQQMKGVTVLRPSWLCNWNDLTSKNLHPIITDQNCNSIISDAAHSSRWFVPAPYLWVLTQVSSCMTLIFQELLQHRPAAAGLSFQKHLRKNGMAVGWGFALTESPFVPAWCVVSNFSFIACIAKLIHF